MKRYRALVPLYYPGSPSVVRKILAGENPGMHERAVKVIEAGKWADALVALIPITTVRLYCRKGLLEEIDVEAPSGRGE